MPPEDAYLLQRLALATYKSKLPTEHEALLEAQELLRLLHPDISNDMQTLGLWGSVHKRLWELDPKPQYLDEAVTAYERGFNMANDYYNGINFAFLLNVRAACTAGTDDAIADKVMAGRVRRKVIDITGRWLLNNPLPEYNQASAGAMHDSLKNWYWVKVTIGEAYIGLGDEVAAKQHLEEAYEKVPEEWMKESTEEQMRKLRHLLAKA